MTDVSQLTEYRNPSSAGCRVASQYARQAQAFCENFTGLEEGVDRYDLLLLVKKIGQQAGFTPRMIQLLDYYMAFTRDCDWEEGSRPIVYQSLSRTALDLGITERQIQKLEQGLFQLGAITWNDSGNYKRYGQRHPVTGRILYAYGIELTPLAHLRVKLEQLLAEKQRHDDAWMETKRQISWHRSQLRGTIEELREEGADTGRLAYWQDRYEEGAVQLRSSISLQRMEALLKRHQSLLNELRTEAGAGTADKTKTLQRPSIAKETGIQTPGSELEFVHYKSTTQESFDESNPSGPPGRGFQESVAAPTELDLKPSSGGLEHVSIGVAVNAASERFRALLPTEPNWLDLADAAERLRPDLQISKASWGEACQMLGRTRAALCLLITDQASLRPENAVAQPAAYFRSLINRGRAGELQLHRSLFGLLKRSREAAS